ncbi:MAG TPA: Rieske 2Fe-2S domain-containing protein [Terracidiphilus sp.]|nr:Rieske 2Fe-2S domain-containing protein [Terracidiphilus sp.]
MTTEINESAKPEGCAACSKKRRYQQDFPIDWDGDNYVSRREMVKFLTLGSLLLAMANWVTAFARRLVRGGSSTVKLLGPASALDQNSAMLFRYPTANSPCIAIRTPQGELVAYSQVCTHLSCAVVYDKDANQLVCPCHRGVFSISQGAPVAGPPTRPLPKVAIEQRGDQIYATGFEV